jgi:hypothetical protein
MKVVCLGIFDRGDISKERVHFRAIADISLQFYAIYDTNYLGDDKIQTQHKNCFWFAPFQVKAGQNVVLYTRIGNQNTEPRNDGSVFHFFFRGLNQPIYTQPEKCAVIFELANWITSKKGA